MQNPVETNIGVLEEKGNCVPFEELLASATFAPNRAIPHGVTSLQLEKYREIAKELMNETLKRATLPEAGKIVSVTEDREIIIGETIIGGADEIDFGEEVPRSHQTLISAIRSYFTAMLPNKPAKRALAAIEMHTHGRCKISTPTPSDFAALLLAGCYPRARTAAFTISPEKMDIVFRGPHTPQLGLKEVTKRICYWEGACYSLYRSLTQPVSTPFSLPKEEQPAILGHILNSFAGQIARVYDLKFFACNLGNDTARLNTVFPHWQGIDLTPGRFPSLRTYDRYFFTENNP